MAFDRFSQVEFEKFLEVRPDGKPFEKGGFHRIPVPGTIELVYAKKVGPDLSLRIYSTIEDGFAREKAKDAIRVMIVWRPSEQEQELMLKDGVIDANVKWPIKVGGETKVLRVPTWRKNLAERLAHYEEIMPPRCDCGCPKVYRTPKKSKGHTWEAFWGCVLYKKCPLKTGVKPSRPSISKPVQSPKSFVQPIPQPKPAQNLQTPKNDGKSMWDELPDWQSIPENLRRSGSKIPYNQPPY